MSTDSPASNSSGVCEECGKSVGAALLASSGGQMLCPDCCGDEEASQETLAADHMGAGLTELECQACGTTAAELLTTAEGRKLCPECYWQQESQRLTTVPTDGSGSLPAPDPSTDFDAATIAEMPPVKRQAGPGTCEECGKGTLKRVPASDGRLLCERCVWEVEQNQSTLSMDAVAGEAGVADAVGTCQACQKTETSLLESPDGRKLCPDCYIEQA